MEEFNTYCRLCLVQSENLLSIFENVNNIPLEMSTCLSIEITSEDLLPKNICHKCADLLHGYYNFYINSKCCEQWLLAGLMDAGSFDMMENNWTGETEQRVTNKPLDIGNLNAKSGNEDEFLAEFLDSSNNSFDLELLANSNALDCLSDVNPAPDDVTKKLLQSGVKLTKINSVNDSVPQDDSYEIHMEIDVLDSDLDIVNKILAKQGQRTPISSSLPSNSPEKYAENYSCMSCKAVFNHFDSLANHMGSCEALKRTCVDCGIVYETKEKMLRHRTVHSKMQTHKCEKCNKEFVGIDRFNQHYEKCHSDFVAESGCLYRCRECSKLFKSKDELYLHAKSHIKLKFRAQQDKFVCEDCGNGYSNKASLLNHRRVKHKTVEEETGSCVYRCKVCLALFVDRNELYSHIKHHTGIFENTQHLCDTCGKSFNSYNALSRHAIIHVGKKYQCEICTRQYMNAELLEKHLLNHKLNTKVCEVCGLVFTNEILLIKHQSIHKR